MKSRHRKSCELNFLWQVFISFLDRRCTVFLSGDHISSAWKGGREEKKNSDCLDSEKCLDINHSTHSRVLADCRTLKINCSFVEQLLSDSLLWVFATRSHRCCGELFAFMSASRRENNCIEMWYIAIIICVQLQFAEMNSPSEKLNSIVDVTWQKPQRVMEHLTGMCRKHATRKTALCWRKKKKIP